MKTHTPDVIFRKFSIAVPISQVSLYDKSNFLLYFCNMENDDFDKAIPGYIKTARLAMKMSQDQLAEVFDCTKSNVSGWEKGRHIPSYKILCTIAKMSGIPLPHDKAVEVLGTYGIDVKNLNLGKADLIKTALEIPAENDDQARKILITFNKENKKVDGQ